MRYYLDTNILVFLLTRNISELSRNVVDIVEDYGNILLTSSVCLHELVHLAHIGKVEYVRGRKATAEDVLKWLAESNIDVVHTTNQHFKTYVSLPIRDDHRDPFDRLIIAQSITDHIPLVSSDRKFSSYERYGLELVYNDR